MHLEECPPKLWDLSHNFALKGILPQLAGGKLFVLPGRRATPAGMSRYAAAGLAFFSYNSATVNLLALSCPDGAPFSLRDEKGGKGASKRGGARCGAQPPLFKISPLRTRATYSAYVFRRLVPSAPGCGSGRWGAFFSAEGVFFSQF